MLNLARLSDKERAEVFISTAMKMKLSEALVEKDFWVCWMLEILFHHSEYSKNFAFKGGTSLSKCYGVIERFSEDIDIILDWRVLGYEANEPWDNRSKSADSKFCEEIKARTEKFIHDVLLPQLDIKAESQKISGYRFYVDDSDKQTLRFSYPQLFKDEALVKEIRLEIGALAAWTPLREKIITPFVAEQYPNAFGVPSTKIRTIEAKRTFWEKATILHSESFRSNGKVPDRYSRHYYDLYMLYNSSIKGKAFADLYLLKQVVDFKTKFYRSNRSRYDLATKDNLQFIPSDNYLKILKEDYMKMQSMIFGYVPEFDEILSGLTNLLSELKQL